MKLSADIEANCRLMNFLVILSHFPPFPHASFLIVRVVKSIPFLLNSYIVVSCSKHHFHHTFDGNPLHLAIVVP